MLHTYALMVEGADVTFYRDGKQTDYLLDNPFYLLGNSPTEEES